MRVSVRVKVRARLRVRLWVRVRVRVKAGRALAGEQGRAWLARRLLLPRKGRALRRERRRVAPAAHDLHGVRPRAAVRPGWGWGEGEGEGEGYYAPL